MFCLFSKKFFFFFIFFFLESLLSRQSWKSILDGSQLLPYVEIYLPHITVLILFEPGYFGFVHA